MQRERIAAGALVQSLGDARVEGHPAGQCRDRRIVRERSEFDRFDHALRVDPRRTFRARCEERLPELRQQRAHEASGVAVEVVRVVDDDQLSATEFGDASRERFELDAFVRRLAGDGLHERLDPREGKRAVPGRQVHDCGGRVERAEERAQQLALPHSGLAHHDRDALPIGLERVSQAAQFRLATDEREPLLRSRQYESRSESAGDFCGELAEGDARPLERQPCGMHAACGEVGLDERRPREFAVRIAIEQTLRQPHVARQLQGSFQGGFVHRLEALSKHEAPIVEGALEKRTGVQQQSRLRVLGRRAFEAGAIDLRFTDPTHRRRIGLQEAVGVESPVPQRAPNRIQGALEAVSAALAVDVGPEASDQVFPREIRAGVQCEERAEHAGFHRGEFGELDPIADQ